MSGSAPEPRPSVISLPIWIFVGASLICSCCMSVLTATKSTCVMPASIIRSTALRPAPPTPTTLITARYEAVSGARSRRAGWSGSGSSQRDGGRSLDAGSGSGAGAGATRIGVGPAAFDFLAFGGSACRCCCSAASCSFAWRWAASVARKSSASGPSRMLARFLAIEHLLRKVTVKLGRLTLGLVGEHRGALNGSLGKADRLPNARAVDEVAEVLAQDLVRFAGVGQPAVVHRRQDSNDLDLRVQVLAHHRQRVLELNEAAQREVLGLHRHDHAGSRDERVDGQQAERRRSVDEDVVVALLDVDERLLQRALAT